MGIGNAVEGSLVSRSNNDMTAKEKFDLHVLIVPIIASQVYDDFPPAHALP